jgi:hypothetical protein
MRYSANKEVEEKRGGRFVWDGVSIFYLWGQKLQKVLFN